MDKKATTLIERFGFKDIDLTTPEHDKMLLWILDKKNILKVLTDVGICYDEENKAYFKNIRAESPVLGYNNFNIGFIDVEIIIKYMKKMGDYDYPQKAQDHICIEIKPYIHSIGELIRQINLYRSHQEGKDNTTYYWVVITKTPNLKDVFSTQNIYIYEFNSL